MSTRHQHHPHYKSICMHVDSIIDCGGTFKLRCAATGNLKQLSRDEAIDMICQGFSESVIVDRSAINWAEKLAGALESILLAPKHNQGKVRDDAKQVLANYIQHSICDAHLD